MQENRIIVVSDCPPLFLRPRKAKTHFSTFGQVSEVKTIGDAIHVTFASPSQAQAAKKQGASWNGARLKIDWPKDEIADELEWGSDYAMDEPEEKAKKRASDPTPEKVVEAKTEKITLRNFQRVPALTAEDQFQVLIERDKLLRSKIYKNSNIKTAMATKGTCPDMCPEKERLLRSVRRLVSNFETFSGTMTMDPKLAVKQYSRSSADQEEPLQHELRPEPVLTMTMTYLINHIICRIEEQDELDLRDWYDFCWDRLRAVRKDIIQQQLCDLKTVTIVEQCARFHIICYDRLLGQPREVFDDKINTENLMNCLQSLVHMYEDLGKHGIVCPNEGEFNAYMILVKINSGDLLWEFKKYPDRLRHSDQMMEAVRIHSAYNNNMYSDFFRLVRETSYMNACLMQRFFSHVRANALRAIIKAYCPPNKQGKIPLEYLTGALKLNCHEDAIDFCEAHGMTLAEDEDEFIVGRYDFINADTSGLITLSYLVEEKRAHVSVAVAGTPEPLPDFNYEVYSSFDENGILKEDAMDASDQEEKMLRDIVSRDLVTREKKMEDEPMEEMEEETEEESVLEESFEEEEFEEVPETKLPTPIPTPSPPPQVFTFKIDTTPPLPQLSPLPITKKPIFVPSPPAKKLPPPPSPTFRRPPQPTPSPPIKKAPLKSPLPTDKTPLQPPEKKSNETLQKLRRKLHENMKRVSVRKYAKLWKQKVEKLKRSRSFALDSALLSQMSVTEHLMLWGSRCKRSGPIYHRLKERSEVSKVSSLILNTDIVDRVDAGVRRIAAVLVEDLGRTSIDYAWKYGNIAQPPHIFWKLVFSLPENHGSTFHSKFALWLREAFYVHHNLGDVEHRMSKCGVPVFISVRVSEGTKNLQLSRNLSALVAVKVSNWESDGEFQDRVCEHLELKNNPIPVAFLSLNTPPPSLEVDGVTHIHRASWTSTESITEALRSLARNTFLAETKIESLQYFMEFVSEKFIDALHETSFLSERLSLLLTQPPNIINLYNLFVEKVKDIILAAYNSKMYATGVEFKPFIDKYEPREKLPDHSEGFSKVLEKTFSYIYLENLPWPPNSSQELFNVLKAYCDDLNAPGLLSKIIRMINPPDDDDPDKNLQNHLFSINWLRVLENLMQAKVRNNLLNFNIVYSKREIDQMLESHWWLEIDSLLKNDM